MTTRPAPAFLGALVLGAVAGAAWRAASAVKQTGPSTSAPGADSQARTLHGSAALLAASVLADSALEHYRGSFENPGMFAPLLSSALALGSAVEGAAAASPAAYAFRKTSYRLSIGVGAIGLSFHIYNIFKRPGGLSWLNLFYGAPLGAPAALSVCGLIGLAAERLAMQRSETPRLLGLPAGRALAALTGIALAGTVGEVALFHFRGAFQNPAMYAPVVLPPVGATLLVKASVEPPATSHPLTRAWLWMSATLGVIGMGFHAYGVARAMGGWRNWSQNLIDGPPLPAPPSFSALSLAGLASLSLIERDAHARDRQAP
ncbi:MAG: hypothetical protein ACR652_22285 [Methylocystis sp.]|uniref:hypothetical protein n=1 Tax=Methylocystis sp. TaxID=1911079 RepID=UPI003DA33C2B